MIANASQRDPIEHLIGGMGSGMSNYITGMEAQGQTQLVHSDRLPVDLDGEREEDWTVLGFSFGDPDPADPLFRPATLPDGWSRQGSDHSMWSYVVDERGIRRVGIFYKAAFYDRSAHMYLVNVGGEAASGFFYNETPIPWDTLTDSERGQARQGLERSLSNISLHPDIYDKDGSRMPRIVAEMAAHPTR